MVHMNRAVVTSAVVVCVQVFTITTPEDQQSQAHSFVLRMSPNAKRTYYLAGTSKYEIPCGDIELSAVFEEMAAAKQMGLSVLDWGVHNASLEDVFIRLAQITMQKSTSVEEKAKVQD